MATPHLRHWVATTSRSLPKPRSDHYLNVFNLHFLVSIRDSVISASLSEGFFERLAVWNYLQMVLFVIKGLGVENETGKRYR